MAKKETPCWVCDRPTMVKDVAEERTLYPGGRYQVMCKSCKSKQLQDAIIKERKELGLHGPAQAFDR